jgi:hypothetical protein
MSRLWLLAVLLLPGCSNAPIAGTLDCLFPSRLRGSPDRGRAADPTRDRDLLDPPGVTPVDRRPEADPLPFEDPRRGTSGPAPRLGEPLRRTTGPVPRDGGNDGDLPLLAPPIGVNDRLPPPPGAR